MNPRRIWAVARKEFLHVLRDPWSLGMALAIPVLMMVLFGYALTLDVDSVPLVVWDQSDTPASRDLVCRFTGSRYFSLCGQVSGYREMERGTMEQLIATPVRGTELVLGKLLPYWVIGMADVLLSVLMAEFFFDVPLRGSVSLPFIVSAVFLAGALSLGMLISISAKNQLAASQMAMLTTFVPSYLLSGFMFSISNMPHAIQAVTYLIPARYFIKLLKGIYLKGVGLEILALPAALLVLFGAGVMLFAVVKFRKKLE